MCIIFFEGSHFNFWLPPLVAWLVMCWKGILLVLPFAGLLFISAAEAQADWMSDTFAMLLFFVIPTLLSIFWDAAKTVKSRQPGNECACPICNGKNRDVIELSPRSKTEPD
jgi:hypothetical protein